MTVTIIDGTDGEELGCDCYGGCWGDHSRGWPGLAFDTRSNAEEAWRLCHQELDGMPRANSVGRGQYVLGRDYVLRFATAALRDAHVQRLADLGVLPGARPATPTAAVLAEVAVERARQDAEWGEQNHPDHPPGETWAALGRLLEAQARATLRTTGGLSWSAVMAEEVGEALNAPDAAALRDELVQVAAVAVAWIEAIDRRGGR